MRNTVHAEQPRGPVEFHRATAFEAITTGRALIDAGATGLYIYDDEIDAAHWPDEFAELHAMTVAARSVSDLRSSRSRCSLRRSVLPPGRDGKCLGGPTHRARRSIAVILRADECRCGIPVPIGTLGSWSI
jgi:hypothetical protein